MIRISAKIEVRENSIVANLSHDFGRYYLSLLPKYLKVNGQRYTPHITIVRSFECPNKTKWVSYNEQLITVVYEPLIKFDGTYYFLDCYSEEISRIRLEQGLERYRMYECYHITIGNTKCNPYGIDG